MKWLEEVNSWIEYAIEWCKYGIAIVEAVKNGIRVVTTSWPGPVPVRRTIQPGKPVGSVSEPTQETDTLHSRTGTA